MSRLVDTRGRGVDRVTEAGLVFDGVEYEVDCIILRDRVRGRDGLYAAGGI